DNCVKEFGKYDVLIEKANLDPKDCVVLEDSLQEAKLVLKSNLSVILVENPEFPFINKKEICEKNNTHIIQGLRNSL
ncbi:29433_t:CDS:2, partial [Racocetra persica]